MPNFSPQFLKENSNLPAPQGRVRFQNIEVSGFVSCPIILKVGTFKDI